MQIPFNSTNLSANLDAGLSPVWSLVAERFLLFANKTLLQAKSYWSKIAMDEQIKLGLSSPYIRNLIKYRKLVGSLDLPAENLKQKLRRVTVNRVINERRKYCVTLSSMSLPTNLGMWFKKKPWVNDSAYSKILAEFRSCNSGLGNRGPTRDGRFYKMCPLCHKVIKVI